MKPINRNTVKAIIRKKGKWSGYMAQSNVNAFHIKGGWALGYKVTWTSIEQMQKDIDRFHIYNDDPELGHRVRLWTER